MIILRVIDLIFDPRFPWMFWRLLNLSKNRKNKNIKQNNVYIALTFDIEQDDGSNGIKSIKKTLKFLKTISKDLGGKKATFFVQGDLVKKIFFQIKRLSREHEIGLHGYFHDRLWGRPVWFSKEKPLSKQEKEYYLNYAIKLFSDYSLPKPQSFRAQNLIIDRETIEILNKLGFLIDSSFQSFRFFSEPAKKSGIWEIPVSGLPRPKLKFKRKIPTLDFQVLNMANLVKLPEKEWQENIEATLSAQKPPCLVFLGHSWDFEKRFFLKFLTFLENNWKVKYLTMKELGKMFEAKEKENKRYG